MTFRTWWPSSQTSSAPASASLPTARSMIPIPIGLFSGGLGPVYSSAGLDTQIGNAIGGVAGPLVAARVAAGFVPVPLTSPPLASIPPITMGALDFDVPSVSITGVPAGVVLQGNSISLTAAHERRNRSVHVRVDEERLAVRDDADHHRHPCARRHDVRGDGDRLARGCVEHGDDRGSRLRLHGRRQPDEPAGPDDRDEHVRGHGERWFPGSPLAGLPTIGLSLSGLPSGATASFSPPSGTAGGFTSTLTITTANAPPGTYALTLTGTDARPLIGGTRIGNPESDDPHSCPGHPRP